MCDALATTVNTACSNCKARGHPNLVVMAAHAPHLLSQLQRALVNARNARVAPDHLAIRVASDLPSIAVAWTSVIV
jgi:precorrin-6B methylase 2